jgi:Rab-like protein 5
MKLKIVVAGPKGSGKTMISNYITGHGEKLFSDSYDPTVGVRIVEHELSLQGINETFNVELWDASGDHQYEACWKAIMHESDGVILVYNPDAPAQDQQLGDWFDFFVKKNGLKDEQCLIFAHRGQSSDKFRPRKYHIISQSALLITDRFLRLYCN